MPGMLTATDIDPARVRWGRRGDFVIQLAASPQNLARKQQQTAASLRLRNSGDYALGFGMDRSFTGRAKKYPDEFFGWRLPGILDLTSQISRRPILPAHRRRRYRTSFAHLPWWEHVMKTYEYPVSDDGRLGTFFEFPDEEYVQVERGRSHAVVLWSCTKPIAAVLNLLRVAVSANGDEDIFITFGSGETEDVSGDELEHWTSKLEALDILRVVVEGEAGSASWERERVKLKRGHRRLAECSFASEAFDMKLLDYLVSETGSEEVSHIGKSGLTPVENALGRYVMGI